MKTSNMAYVVLLLISFVAQSQIIHLPSTVSIWDGFERDPEKRTSSAPYLSGDTFRAFCDHIFDETKMFLDVDAIKAGDTVFVVADFFPFFFQEVYPQIKCPFILVSHNRDTAAPAEYVSYLDEEKIVAWFAVNIDCIHPKLQAIPIGLANNYWPHGKTDVVKKQSARPVGKTILLCASHISLSHPSRQHVYDHFRRARYCVFFNSKPTEKYLFDLRKSKFVLSPRGNGLDCHRTWETLYMGAIPAVPSTSINSVYDDLPVLIVDNWAKLTADFLEQKWNEFSKKTFKLEKLYADYWFDLISRVQQSVRGH